MVLSYDDGMQELAIGASWMAGRRISWHCRTPALFSSCISSGKGTLLNFSSDDWWLSKSD